MKKSKKGITLIALIITIIILLIISAVSIVLTIGDNGIIIKSQMAKTESDKSINNEEQKLKQYEEFIGAHINGDRNDVAYNKCIISIGEDNTLHISGVDNIVGFAVIIDNECVELTSDLNYKVKILYKSKKNVYIIAIDKEVNIYKSNTVEVEGTELISIPKMTSAIAPFGEVTCSEKSIDTNDGWSAFSGFWTDENIQNYGQNESYYAAKNRCWTTNNSTTVYPAWLQYKFDNMQIIPHKFEYMSSYSWGYGCKHSIVIQGSNDGENWNDLIEETTCNPFTKYELVPTKNIQKYQYYRLKVLSATESWGGRADILMFQVYGY